MNSDSFSAVPAAFGGLLLGTIVWGSVLYAAAADVNYYRAVIMDDAKREAYVKREKVLEETKAVLGR